LVALRTKAPWGFFFHPYDLIDANIANFAANQRQMEGIPDVESQRATETARWLSAREEQLQSIAGLSQTGATWD